MNQALFSAVGQFRRRCHQWLGGGFDYRNAYRKAALDQAYWQIVGADTKEEFEALGKGKRQLLIGQGLTPGSRVLDVGCGTGTLTESLTEFLSPEGLYYGTDIAREAIEFCKTKFRRPNFFFVQNALLEVPLKGLAFDIIYFGSVFTHIYPDEIGAMLVEVKRLLAPEGVIVADLFADPTTEQFRGDRGMVVINEACVNATFATTGLWYELLGNVACAPEGHHAYRAWPCSAATRRLTYALLHPAATRARSVSRSA